MSVDSSSDLSKTSVFSSRSKRSGKSLAEKFQKLGIDLGRPLKFSQPAHTLQYMVIKMADSHSSNIAIRTPNLNLEQIVYYQPELVMEQSSPKKSVYKIETFQTKSVGPKECRRISDIEVKSFKPTKKMKFRRRKRHSSVIAKVEEILNRGKIMDSISRDPSEESILFYEEEPEEPKPKEINDLPETVLQKIFFWLDEKERVLVLPRVCKSWYYILKEPIFWAELEFTGNKVSADIIIGLLKRYPTLKKLSLTSVPGAFDILQELCRCNHDIRELSVKHCNINRLDFSRIMIHVVSCCTDLEVLDIKGMRFQSDRFYLELGRLKNLRHVNLTGNKLLKSQDLITLAVNCRALQDLRILDINLDSTQGTVLRDEDLIFITSHLQASLSTLKMDMHQLGNTSYQAILKCLQLKCLGLKNCLLLTSDVFRQLPVLKNLKRLKITRAINLKGEDFQHVFSSDSTRNLRSLDLNGCWNIGESGIKSIGSKLVRLKSLSLKNCKSVKKNHLTHLAKCSSLEELNVAHTGVDSSNLVLVSEYLKNLKMLIVGWDVQHRTLRSLKKSLPALEIKLSFSEYQKDERNFSSA